MAYNTIFSWALLQTIKASIVSKNNDLVSGILGEQFRMKMMVSQRSKGAPTISEGIPVSFTVAIQETQDNTKDRGNRNDPV